MGTAIDIGTNAFAEASVTTGSASAAYGNATSGIISIATKTGNPTRYQGSLGFETDEPFGVAHGIGFNRLEAGFSGPLAQRLTFTINGTLEGRQSVEEGFSSQDTPVFISAGVDTTVRQVSIVEDDTSTVLDERRVADTTLVDVYRYAISRGRCDQFANAGAAGINGPDAAAIPGYGITTGWTATGCGFRRPRALCCRSVASSTIHTVRGLASRSAWQPAGSKAIGSISSSATSTVYRSPTISAGSPTGAGWLRSTGSKIFPGAPRGPSRSTWRCRTSKTAPSAVRSPSRASFRLATPSAASFSGRWTSCLISTTSRLPTG